MPGYKVFYCGYCDTNRRFWWEANEDGGDYYCGTCSVSLTSSELRYSRPENSGQGIAQKEYDQ